MRKEARKVTQKKQPSFSKQECKNPSLIACKSSSSNSTFPITSTSLISKYSDSTNINENVKRFSSRLQTSKQQVPQSKLNEQTNKVFETETSQATRDSRKPESSNEYITIQQDESASSASSKNHTFKNICEEIKNKNDKTKTLIGCATPPDVPQMSKEIGITNEVENRNVTTCIQDSSELALPNDKRNSFDQDASFISSQDKLDISSWGLPEDVLQKYKENGISHMFAWQVECLSLPGVLEGHNLVYSAPTSAGKTLVAEIILLKRVLEMGRKGIFILPFVSVTREKTFYLQHLFGGIGIKVEGFMGGQAPPGGFQKTDIAICTIEKANNLINRLIEEQKVDSLGIIVVDELHMVGDPQRGYLLELLLTKLLYISASNEDSIHIQVVGMSATLPNLHVVAKWLKAQLYSTSYRPIPLLQMVKVGPLLYKEDFTLLRDLRSSNLIELKDDQDHLIQLCLETILEGFSILVFCPTKAWCEKISLSIASNFFSIGKPGSKYPEKVIRSLRERINGNDLRRIITALRGCPAGLDSVLEKALAFGAGFHHAGLTFDERDILEGAFRAGYLPVLVATSTLSSGVNLPARRVIIRSPNSGTELLNPLVYKQMIGRAGRKGKDTQGESILMCAPYEKHKAEQLVTSSLPPITSCLQRHSSLSSSMKRAVLEVVVSGVAKSEKEIRQYWNCTLLAASVSESQENSSSQPAIEESINYLLDSELARYLGNEEKYLAGTQLGSAILASGLSPDEGLHVFSELQRARQCFVLENELHLVYQVTPIYVSNSWPNIDWLRFLQLWDGLPPGMKKVGELVGVEESFIVRAMKGIVNSKILKQRSLLAIHQRFYAALALYDLVHEMALRAIVDKFGATKGLLQALQQSAATFAGMVTIFCNRLGWQNLELLIAQYQNRLQFGIQRDLCDLVRISLLNGRRARLLFDAGLETIAQIAHSTFKSIEDILLNAGPFQSRKDAAHGFILAPNGRPLSIPEASKSIVNDARRLLQKELGLDYIDWDQSGLNKGLSSVKQKEQKNVAPASIIAKPSTSYISPHKYESPPITCDKNTSSPNMCSPSLKRSSPTSSENERECKTPRLGAEAMATCKKDPKAIEGSEHNFSSKKENNSKQLSSDKRLGAEAMATCKKDPKTIEGSEHNFSSKKENNSKQLSSDKNSTNPILTSHFDDYVQVKEDKKENLHKEKNKKVYKLSNPESPQIGDKSKLSIDIKPVKPKAKASFLFAKPKTDVIDKDDSHSIYIPESQESPSRRQNITSKIHTKPQSSSTNFIKVKKVPSEVMPLTRKQKLAPCTKSDLNSEVELSESLKAAVTSEVMLLTQKEKLALCAKPDLNSEVELSESLKAAVPSEVMLLAQKKKLTLCEEPDLNSDVELSESVKPAVPLPQNKKLALCVEPDLNSDVELSDSLKVALFETMFEDGSHSDQPVLQALNTRTSSLSADLFDLSDMEEKQESSWLVGSTEYEPLMLKNLFSLKKDKSAKKTNYELRSRTKIESMGTKGNIRIDEMKTPLYHACSEHINFTFNGSFNEIDELKSPLKHRNNLYKEGSELVSRSIPTASPDDLFLSDASQSPETSFQNIISKFSNCDDNLLTADANGKDDLIIMEGGELSLTRENIEEDLSTFESTIFKAFNGEDNNVISSSFHNEAENCCSMQIRKKSRIEGKDEEVDKNDLSIKEKNLQLIKHKQTESSSGLIIQNKDNSLSSNIEILSPSPFDDYSSIVLTPGIEAILQGKSSLASKLKTLKRESTPIEVLTRTSLEKCNLLTSETSFVSNEHESKHTNILDSLSPWESQKLPVSKRTKSPVEYIMPLDTSFETTVDKINQNSNTLKAFEDLQQKSEYISSEISQEVTRSLCIIDVASDKRLFDVFLKEWKSKEHFSLALACEKSPQKKVAIGWRFCGRSKRALSQKQLVAGLVIPQSDLYLIGIAIAWGHTDAYYINLKSKSEVSTNESLQDLSLSVSSLSNNQVSLQDRVNAIKEVLCHEASKKTIGIWQVKECLKLLHRCGIGFSQSNYLDPKVAAWLLDPMDKEKNLHNMVMNYADDFSNLLDHVGKTTGTSNIGICDDSKANPGQARIHSAIESVLVYHLVDAFNFKLEEARLKEIWESVEMPVMFCLTLLELNGIGFQHSECLDQKALLQEKLELLESEAFHLAGHSFSLSSSNDVAKVLYLELRLQPSSGENIQGGKRTALSKRGRRVVHATNKEALEKLKGVHRLPTVILEWRKIKAALTKFVYPLCNEIVGCNVSGEERIFPVASTFTATGRVSFHEPNIQNVPKDFDVDLPNNRPSTSRESKRGKIHSSAQILRQLAPLLDRAEPSEIRTISLRNAFVAGKGRLLLAADYSQLELRILAHLSADEELLTAINGGEDVFMSIASKIHSVLVSDVSDALRQEAKQICYGIIYGVSDNTLAEQLGISETAAHEFITKFHNRFPRIREFVKTTLDEARERGFVVTIDGRRRFLPALLSSSCPLWEKGQSERQAVNTRVQGSAADLIKKAMIAIQTNLQDTFPDSPFSLTQTLQRGQVLSGAYLVLQLHDELIYEVMSEDVIQVAQIVKHHMEAVCQLSVKLPVKIKVGASWGTLQTLNL